MLNFYNAVKTIYGPTNHCVTLLKTADGQTLLKDQNSILLRWAEHFDTLLNQDSDADPTILDELPELPPIHDFSLPPAFQEVLSSVRSLKNNKSPSADNIPAELLKEGGYICMRTLYQYITKAWTDESIPQQWRDTNIVVIYCIRTRVTRPYAVTVGAYHAFLLVVRSWPKCCIRDLLTTSQSQCCQNHSVGLGRTGARST